MDLSVIIVNWNSADFVKQCLRSIFSNSIKIQFEVIVIDSGSFDGCRKIVESEFPEARFIQSEENVGFAKANNLGFMESTGRNVLFLNPDTEVVGPALETLCFAIDELPDAGAVGARLLNGDGSLQTSCIMAYPTITNQVLDADFLRSRFPNSKLWGNAPLFTGATTPSPVEAISGACLLMKRKVCEEVGAFSIGYFMYTEDIDLAYKCTEHGYVNYHVPTAQVIHFGDGSVKKARTNFAVVMAADAVRRFFQRYRGKGYAGVYRASLGGAALCRLGLIGVGVLAGKNRELLKGAWSRWKSILRWSVGLERWVLDYE